MLAALGIGWALMLIVLGGIDLTLGGLTITSNEPRRPFYVGMLAAAMHVWLTGVDPWRLRLDRLRRRIPAGLSQVVASWLRADRLAVLLTIVTLLVGLRWTSTTAAAASPAAVIARGSGDRPADPESQIPATAKAAATPYSPGEANPPRSLTIVMHLPPASQAAWAMLRSLQLP